MTPPLKDRIDSLSPEKQELFKRLLAKQRGEQAAPVVPRETSEPLPLSYAQQRLWFLEQLEPSATLYSVPVAFRLEGPLDRQVLERSLRDVIRWFDACYERGWTVPTWPTEFGGAGL